MRTELKCVWLGIAAMLATLLLPSGATAQAGRSVWFQNSCHYPVRVLYYHQHANGSWVTHGWYDVAANSDRSELLAGKRPLVHWDGQPLYFYAEATNGQAVYWQGSTYAQFNGVRYGTLEAELYVENGNFTHTLGCDGY